MTSIPLLFIWEFVVTHDKLPKDFYLQVVVIVFIISLAPWASKMNQIACCDWLPEWARLELSCLLRTTHHVLREKFSWKLNNKSFIDQACSVLMSGYWPCSFCVSSWTSTPSIKTQKKNLVNVQPSWPHTRLITHVYYMAQSHKDWELPNSQIWLAEMDIDRGLDFPI